MNEEMQQDRTSETSRVAFDLLDPLTQQAEEKARVVILRSYFILFVCVQNGFAFFSKSS